MDGRYHLYFWLMQTALAPYGGLLYVSAEMDIFIQRKCGEMTIDDDDDGHGNMAGCLARHPIFGISIITA